MCVEVNLISFVVLDTYEQKTDWPKDVIYLSFSSWNDYWFRTLFNVTYIDNEMQSHELGQIKIGFVGQDSEKPTLEVIESSFIKLDRRFFSLAESVDFYKNLYSFGKHFGDEVLINLNCVLTSRDVMRRAGTEEVFLKSLLRGVHIATLSKQLGRIRRGDSVLTPFNFNFYRPDDVFSSIRLEFEVIPDSLPPTNIHTLIGRNGLGKTTILHGMVNAVVKDRSDSETGVFLDYFDEKVSRNFFSAVISIAFSAFDPFVFFDEEEYGNEKGNKKYNPRYHYIGLKGAQKNDLSENDFLDDLFARCAESIYRIFSNDAKRDLWFAAMNDLESDDNFKELNVQGLIVCESNELIDKCILTMESMSSGHAIVFISITMLVDRLQEKTLVLFDEPESHLHPPLLAALVRVMSTLLSRRNGVAIIATHSPVVVQEVPRSCCWVLTRYGDVVDCSRPSIETFAENVGVITKEVFKLEMEKSGYHSLLKKQVDKGYSYEKILHTFGGKLGFEGKAVLVSMVALRDESIN